MNTLDSKKLKSTSFLFICSLVGLVPSCLFAEENIIELKSFKVEQIVERSTNQLPLYIPLANNAVAKSKIDSIRITALIRNNSRKPVYAVAVEPELFLLLAYDKESAFPSIKQLSKNSDSNQNNRILNKRWVWNRALASDGIQMIKPGQTKKIVMDNLDVAVRYSPQEYLIHKMAVRLYVYSRTAKESDYSDNVSEFIYNI